MGLGYALKTLCEDSGPRAVAAHLAEGLKPGSKMRKKCDIYTTPLAEITDAFFDMTRRGSGHAVHCLRALQRGQAHLLEATEANDASAFSNITGQLLVTIIKEQYENPSFILKSRVMKVANPGSNLQEHKIPYLSDVVDKPKRLAQMEPYPATRFFESWVTMPPPEKYGEVCRVSMEMMLSDYTGQAQRSAQSVGKVTGYQEEERIGKVVLGLSGTDALPMTPYNWNGNALNTYVTTAGVGSYVNRIVSNTVLSSDQVNNIEQLFYRQVDPITGRRILAMPRQIICVPEKRWAMKRILTATMERRGNQASDTGILNESPNPIEIGYELLASPILQALLQTETTQTSGIVLSPAQVKEFLIFGDLSQAFGIREVYPMKTEQAPALAPAEFEQDIVLQVKASLYNVPFVYDPRWAGQSTAEVT